MKRFIVILLGLVVGLGSPATLAAQQTSEIVLFEGFERTNSWYAIKDAWKDDDRSIDAVAAGTHATEGAMSLEVSFDIPAGKAATYAVDLKETGDWTYVKSVFVDFFVPANPIKVALAIQTGDDFFWQETPVAQLAPGLDANVRFELQSRTLKSQDTGWANSANLKTPQAIHRLIVKLFADTASKGSIFIDNIRLVKGTTAAASPKAAIRTASEEATGFDPKALIPYGDKKIFISGMNLAWMDFARDLVNFDEKTFIRRVEAIAAAGGNCIRWWIFVDGTASPTFGADGLVKKLPADQIAVLRRALDISYRHGVGLILCLWSFDMLQPGADQARNARLLEDPASTRAFIDNALVPMVRALRGHPGVIAWEVFNEPEGMLPVFGWTPKRTTMEAVQAFTNKVAGAIHREAPDALVTNGSWSVQVVSDANGFFNWYSDEELIKAGGDHKGTLDFYCVHYYPEYLGEVLSPFHNPKGHWGLDKPLVIAEFPSKGIVPIEGKPGFAPKTMLSTEEAYRYAIEHGYAGALSWTMTGHDGFGDVKTSEAAMKALAASYGQYLDVSGRPTDFAPELTRELKDPILAVAKRDWPGVLSLADFVKDPEGGALTFTLTDAGDPDVAQLALSPAGVLSARLPAGGKPGSMTVAVTAKDAGGNELSVKLMVHVVDPDRGNVALFKSVTASSVEKPEVEARFLNDGNPNTRWSSEYRDDQWLQVDLDGVFRVTQAVMSWETAYARVYDILGSADGHSWAVLAKVGQGTGGVEKVALTPAKVRYVRLALKSRATEWGYSLFELSVIGERAK